MISPSYSLTATERVLPRLALDFTTAILDPRVTFTRSGNTATVINSSGVIVGINANLPRFDYNPVTLVCNGLLIEESRTNMLLNSLIDGTSLGTQVVVVTAATRTLSFYGTGSVTLSGAHTAVVSGTGAYPTRTTYTFTPTAGALTLTVSGTVQYAQLEAGAFATSYIPTTASQVTRSADVATMTGTNFSSWYNQSQGAFVAKSYAQTAAYYGAGACMTYLNGTNSLGFNPSTANAGRLLIRQTAGVTVNISQTPMPSTSTWTQALAYKSNDAAYYVNGAQVGTDASVVLPSPTTLYIGSNGDGLGFVNTQVAKISYWPQRLTNAELAAFSTQG